MGLHQACIQKQVPHDIVGVDIRKIEEYPFEFIHSDVFKLDRPFLEQFDLYWASVPCQAYSTMTHCVIKREQNRGNPDYDPENLFKKYPRLIEKTRKLLQSLKKPYIIENVVGAPLKTPITLCGEMFDLQVLRHRLFEINGFYCPQPRHVPHVSGKKYYYICTKQQNKDDSIEAWQKAMGINWIARWKILGEAIPPAYSRYILLEYLKKHPTLDNYIKGAKS